MTQLNSNQRRYDFLALFGRILLASIFIAAGLTKISNWEVNLQYLQSHGIPWTPIFLYPAIFVEVIGGFSLLLGYKARAGAIILALYLIPVTLIFHSFWTYTGVERAAQLMNFMKNISIIGGLVVTSAFGAGALSVDARIGRRKTPTTGEQSKPRLAA